jgi:phosphoglycolate phosphatase
MKLFIERRELVRPGMRVMHLAPEKGLSGYIRSIVGDGYEAFDLVPEKYPFAAAKRLDLVSDVESLPSQQYDLIIHLHVMEHIPCNISAVLYHLNRGLRCTGAQLMCIPFASGYSDETFAPVGKEERTRRFGQFDHVRRFGTRDAGAVLGMLFDLPHDYDLRAIATEDELQDFNIPKGIWTGLSTGTILHVPKSAFKLISPT